MKFTFSKPSRATAKRMFQKDSPVIGMVFADDATGIPLVNIEGEFYGLAEGALYKLDQDVCQQAVADYRKHVQARRLNSGRQFSEAVKAKLRQNAAKARQTFMAKHGKAQVPEVGQH